MGKMSLYPLMLVISLHFFITMSAPNVTTDEEALLQLKAHVNLDPHNFFVPNWKWSATNTSASVCDWVGVTCGIRHRRVTAIKLPKMGFGGTIPPQVGNLSFLVSLNISGNNFSGTLPNELWQLRRLRFIDLSSNSLSGSLPSDMCNNLTQLEWFNATFNEIAGQLPSSLGNCKKLKRMSFAFTKITGRIPQSIGNLTELTELYLGNNNLEGEFPLSIFNISSLKMIVVADNSLSGSLPSDMCNNLTKLEWFYGYSNEITGTLPSSLGDCRNLKGVYFTGNKITGRIPQSIGNLTELMELYLDDNNLEGEFPLSIFNISSLKIIVVSNNSLSGSLPVDLCRHQSLEELQFKSNKITGRIPKSIGNCTFLSVLRLQSNQLTGEIPHEIGNLHNLRVLHFGYNFLAGLIPSAIFNNSIIYVICLNENNLSGHLPSSIGFDLPNLRGLCLAKNNLSGMIPGSICNASKVIGLDLSRNLFSGLIPDTFRNCRQLEILNLGGNHLTTGSSTQRLTSFYSSLTNCKYLRALVIQRNPLKAALPNSIGNLSTSLERLYAGYCELCGGIPVEIGNLSNMIHLVLDHNELAGTIPKTVGKLSQLQGLDFSYNKLQGFIPNDLCKLESISTLKLDSNALQGQIPTCLANLTSLRYLHLSSNRLSSNIPSTFWSLEYILVVDFSLNSLSGTLPLEIGNLEVLTQLNLSGNQLSGYIPSSIGGLKDLTYLILARNGFHGPIPQSFGGLISLQSLDLSGNNLSGEIPTSLEAISYLNHFNVSFNGLEGEIPSGGPFVNFSAESFLHNHALCGSSRLQVPPCKTKSTHKSKANKIVLSYILPTIVITMVALSLIVILIRQRKTNKSPPTENDLLNLATLRRISYLELQQATNSFSASNLLGTGSFGSVYKATLADGMSVAAKVFNLQEDRTLKSFDVECEVIRRIQHRNLVKIISSCSNIDFKALILQYMPQGSLEKWLYSHNYLLNIRQRLEIMIDVASALEYLHHGQSTPIIHCDLKPSNVLLDDDMVAHLIDFGIAKLLGGVDSVTRTITLATIGYMAPEYGSEGLVSTSGDVYSFGILMMETFTGKKPTNATFAGEMSLKRWVEESLPDAITEVIDANLLSIEEEEDHFAAKKNCLSSIMSLALTCPVEIPKDRINAKDALVDLKKIKTKFLKDVQQA